jgi:hypothetical protein
MKFKSAEGFACMSMTNQPQFIWSALEDDFRTFLLNSEIFEPALLAAWDGIETNGYTLVHGF